MSWKDLSKNRSYVMELYHKSKSNGKCVKCRNTVEPWRVTKSGKVKATCHTCSIRIKLRRAGIDEATIKACILDPSYWPDEE